MTKKEADAIIRNLSKFMPISINEEYYDSEYDERWCDEIHQCRMFFYPYLYRKLVYKALSVKQNFKNLLCSGLGTNYIAVADRNEYTITNVYRLMKPIIFRNVSFTYIYDHQTTFATINGQRYISIDVDIYY